MENLIANYPINTCENEFMLPIEYLYNKEELSGDIINDLELLNNNNNNNTSLYDYVFDSDSESRFGEAIKGRWCKYYTTDVGFLKDSQKLYESMYDIEMYSVNEERVNDILITIEDNTDFEERNHYIKDVYLCDKMNQNESLMTWYSCFLVMSPLLSLCLPIFIMIMPLFIIKSQGFNISTKEYFKLLFVLMKKIPIGKLLEIDWTNANSIFYAAISVCAYIFQLYQSFSMCLSFRRNMVSGHDMLYALREYLRNTVYRMEAYIGLSKNYESYANFNKDLSDRMKQINGYVDILEDLPQSKYMIPKKIGKIRCEIYKLYTNNAYKEMIYYANNFNGYLENITAIGKKMGKQMTKANFKTRFSNLIGMYYPAIVGDKKANDVGFKNVQLNDVKINNNKIITGVNASGKTTLLKTVLFNVILSQQIGCGFYKRGKIAVYDKIHCYLNIPDTNGRDSLFQAEARRCKDIIESVEEHQDKKHLCVFDELYSGTNPYEASATGYAYIRYMSKHKNVKLLITTHYLDMCESLLKAKQKSITNYHMEAYYDEANKMVYTYKKKKGITKIKGGVEVLKNLSYPKSIVKEATELIMGGNMNNSK